MADKEATVYIVDVSSCMGQKSNGREQTNFEWAMAYVWDKITSTVATGRKTATLGVVGFRTDGTSNELKADNDFQNISVFQEISQILLPELSRLRKILTISNTDEGDAISAIIIAVSMIVKYCKKLKYRRKIVLVTNGQGSIDADDVTDITSKIKQDDIELVVLGVDFDDLEYGFKEEDKDPAKARNEAVLKGLVDECNGIFGTLAQAIDELGLPRLKATRPVHSYKGFLSLGDPERYDSAMCIDVERYPRTKIRPPPSASQFTHRSDLHNANESTQSSTTLLQESDVLQISPSDPNSLICVGNSRVYQVVDESAPSGTRDVDQNDLAKGYEYGRTAVFISESDLNVTKLETKAVLEIIGFIPWSNYERYMSMSASNIIIAQKANSKAIMALSSIIHALFELDSFAIARLVPKDDKSPELLVLAPSIEIDYECLLDVQIPFAEDVRSYKFPPLDRVMTVSGKVLKDHRNLPSEELKSAMSNYVDRMDLSDFGKDDEGNPAEYMPMTDTFSPVLHRVDQAVRWRAVHPTEPIPPPYEILTRFSQAPDELLGKARGRLEKLIARAEVKKVPPKAKGRKRNRDLIKPLSGLDVDELLGREKKIKISQENTIPDFKQMLDKAEDPSVIEEAARQLSNIIESRIRDNFGYNSDGQVIAELSVLRDEMTEMEEPKIYNDFIAQLKRRLLAEQLGGDRKELWWKIRHSGLGLIEKTSSPQSTVTDDEAKKFLSSK